MSDTVGRAVIKMQTRAGRPVPPNSWSCGGGGHVRENGGKDGRRKGDCGGLGANMCFGEIVPTTRNSFLRTCKLPDHET